MKNIFKLLLITAPLLSCATGYTTAVLAPVTPADGWVKNRRVYVYNCDPVNKTDEAASISTTGTVSYQYRQKTLF